MTVYLDIIFLENLFMNYIILLATGISLKIKIRHGLLIISSILGSIYSVFVYIQNNHNSLNIGLKILLSIFLVFIAYVPKTVKQLTKELIIFYLISFAFGGCAISLMYVVKPENIIQRNGVLIGSYPIKIVLLGGIIGFVIVGIAFKIVKNRVFAKDMICNVKIKVNKSEINVKALIDSGNMLKDPISGMPVIVIEKDKLKSVIPDVILDNLTKILNGEIEKDDMTEYISKFRVIPFSSLGKQNGMLLGIKVEKICLEFEEEVKIINNSVMAIYDKKLSRNENYSALVGLDLIKRGENSEFVRKVKV